VSDFTESGDRFLAIMHVMHDDMPDTAWEAILKAFAGCMRAAVDEMTELLRVLTTASELIDDYSAVVDRLNARNTTE